MPLAAAAFNAFSSAELLKLYTAMSSVCWALAIHEAIVSFIAVPKLIATSSVATEASMSPVKYTCMSPDELDTVA